MLKKNVQKSYTEYSLNTFFIPKMFYFSFWIKNLEISIRHRLGFTIWSKLWVKEFGEKSPNRKGKVLI